MKYRKLRIAWSVAWGIFCVLLIALWVRSYWRIDEVSLAVPRVLVAVVPGGLGIDVATDEPPGWVYVHEPANVWLATLSFPHSRVWGSFYAQSTVVIVPLWFLLGIAASFAAIPWLRQLPYQFSLRTLLIGMTLVAVGLGAIVISMR